MYCPPPNFLAVVFKKQEISQQVVTGMQNLASDFQRFSRGNTPGLSQREGPARPLAGHGEQVPQRSDPNLGPLNFSAVLAPVSNTWSTRIELTSSPLQQDRYCL